MVDDEQQQQPDDLLELQSPSHPQVDPNPVASTSTSSSQGLGLKDQTSASSNTFYSTDSGGINRNTELNRQQGVDMDRDRDRDRDGDGDRVADDDSLPNRTSSSSIESCFVPSRPRNQVSSILPPAAFFAPKRKQHSTSPTWAFASLPNSNTNNNPPSSSTCPIPQHPLSLSRSGSDSTSHHQQRSNSRSSNHHQSQSNSTSPAFNSINLPNDSERGAGPTNSNWKPDSNRPNSPWGVASTINNRDSQDQDHDREHPTSSTTQITTGNGNAGLDPKALQSYYKKGSLKSNKYSREPLLNVDRNQQDGNGEKFNNLSSPTAANGGAISPSKNQTRFSTQSNHRQRGGIGRTIQSQEISTTSQRRSSTKLQSLPGHHLTKERNHTKFQGSNRFFLFGLIMTSSDNPLPFLGSLALLLILAGLFFGFVSPFIWKEVSIAPVIVFAYTWLVATVNMIVTAWRDPGILPRNLDPDPPCSIGESRALDPEDPLAVPLPRMIRIRETDVKVKWCETCGTYRAPRSSHCRVCDNCVENIDHHCTFLNTCIGRRNYFSFFSFLTFSLISAGLCIAFCVLHLYYLTRPTDHPLPRSGFGRGYSAAKAMNQAPVSVLLIALTVVTIFPLLTLFGYHIRLILLNLTTVEQIRISTTKSYDSPSHSSSQDSDSKPPTCCGLILGGPPLSNHPFGNVSTLKNVLEVLARPTTFSSIERYGFWLEDGRRDNPGSNWKENSNPPDSEDQDIKNGNTEENQKDETHVDMREKEIEQRENS